MKTNKFESTSTDESIACVNKLIATSTPFIRINSADRFDWCRVMTDPEDKRIGPWHYRAVYDVLDKNIWSQKGEVLYFVVDEINQLRLVGQSKNKLKDRWRTPPMFDVKTLMPLGEKSLFHTSAWPEIEAGFEKGEKMKYTVRAIFRNDLERECRSIGGPFLPLIEIPETDKHRLSYHVEQWICSLSNRGFDLWNKQGVERRNSY